MTMIFPLVLLAIMLGIFASLMCEGLWRVAVGVVQRHSGGAVGD